MYDLRSRGSRMGSRDLILVLPVRRQRLARARLRVARRCKPGCTECWCRRRGGEFRWVWSDGANLVVPSVGAGVVMPRVCGVCGIRLFAGVVVVSSVGSLAVVGVGVCVVNWVKAPTTRRGGGGLH